MTQELKNVKIGVVSLVKEGANRRNIFLIKGKDSAQVELKAVIKSTDELEGIVFCEVYVPFEKDTDGQFMTPKEIEKMAHSALAIGMNVDQHHDFGSSVGAIVESSIVRFGDVVIKDANGEPVLNEDGSERILKNGSWFAGIKITDKDVLKQAVAGEIDSFSMAGQGQVVEHNEFDAILKSKETLKSYIIAEVEKHENITSLDDGRKERASETVYSLSAILYDTLIDADWEANTAEVKKQMLVESTTQLINQMSLIEKTASDVVKAEKADTEETDDKTDDETDETEETTEKTEDTTETEETELEKSVQIISDAGIALVALQKTNEELQAKVANVEKDFNLYKENSRLNSAQAIDDATNENQLDTVEKQSFVLDTNPWSE